MIIGTPDQVAENLRAAIKDLRFGQLMLLCQYCNVKKDLVNYNSKLFAEKVAPQLVDIWKDWDNK